MGFDGIYFFIRTIKPVICHWSAILISNSLVYLASV